ncbi:glycosyltransferase family 39 protein [bacterium]|nr:glycosyltransferase family 39 protein [candidate division CSSED10-310 bacterium]
MNRYLSGLNKRDIDSVGFDPWVMLAVILSLLLFFTGIADHDVWTPDEPRETQMALEMVENGNWLIPMLAGEPFVEKPPLYYWSSAAGMMLFGGVWSPATIARALSSLFALLTVCALYLFVHYHLGSRIAVTASLMLITMGGFVEMSHWIRIDALLTFLITASVLFFMDAHIRESSGHLFLGYIFLGLAFLTKGLVAIAVVSVPLAVLVLMTRGCGRKLYALHILGGMLMLGIIFLWAVSFKNKAGELLFNEWFWDNQIGRFLGTTRHLGHIHGPTYYLGIIWSVLFPWCFLLFLWVVRPFRLFKANRKEEITIIATFLAWAVGVLILLSIAGTKRSVYLFPLLPAFAALFAWNVQSWPRWLNRFLIVVFGLIAVIGLSLALFEPVLGESHLESLRFQPKPLALLFSFLSFLFLIKCRKDTIIRGVGVTAALYLTAIVSLVPVFDKIKNYPPVVRQFYQKIPQDRLPSICGWNLDQTTRALFPYTVDWTIPIVNDEERIRSILRGEDPEYSAVIVQTEKSLKTKSPLPETSILAEESFLTRRGLKLIAGTHQQM